MSAPTMVQALAICDAACSVVGAQPTAVSLVRAPSGAGSTFVGLSFESRDDALCVAGLMGLGDDRALDDGAVARSGDVEVEGLTINVTVGSPA